jgi:hypothetical protein
MTDDPTGGSAGRAGGRVRAAGLVILVLVLGWALTSTSNPAPHSGGDNAAYVALADALLDGEGYVEPWDPARPPHTKYPPVFALALAAAMALGASTWAGLKTVPLLFGIAAVGGTWAWVHGRRGPVWATAVALLTGCSTAFLYHAHILLSDMPFLALTVGALAAAEGGRRAAGAAARGSDVHVGPSLGSTALAVVLVALAVLTRTAGAPLALALVAGLVLAKRVRAAAVSAAVLAVPMAAWWLRGRGIQAEGAYLNEFWMANPYRPELGEIGWTGLIPRALENAFGYVGGHLPVALVGPSSLGVALGLVVVALAVAGWWRSVRSGIGAAEIFVPLYLGLILVWPVVWSGDRFVLPLLPFVLFYAASALEAGVRAVRPAAVLPVLAACGAGLLLAEGAAVVGAADRAAACRGAVRAGGPWACAGQGMVQFTEAARWSGTNLPAGSVVLTRKPRIWYAMSGVPTRTYPFVADPDVLLEAAAEAGATYVLLDLVGAQAQLLATAIGARPGAFCSVAGFGPADGARTELLGILPEPLRVATEPGAAPTIGACPADMRGSGVDLPPYTSSSSIPIRTSSSPP